MGLWFEGFGLWPGGLTLNPKLGDCIFEFLISFSMTVNLGPQTLKPVFSYEAAERTWRLGSRGSGLGVYGLGSSGLWFRSSGFKRDSASGYKLADYQSSEPEGMQHDEFQSLS